MIKIYHNPRCAKSRETLQILNECGKEFEVIEYLKTPPTGEQLRELTSLLKKKPVEIIRKNEKMFKDNYSDKDLSDEEWLTVLSSNPVLIERPIVTDGKKAVIGRPPENVREILE